MAGFALPMRLPRWPRRIGRPRPAWLALPVVAALLVGGWLWFRDSSFVSVQAVQIRGVSGPGAAQIDAALRRAARQMSTLDANAGALRDAVSAYPEVRAIDVSTSFPHSMRITVSEQPPVAVLQAASGARSAVAANGVLLGGRPVTAALPAIPIESLPHGRVHDAAVLQYLAVLGAAPAPLAHLVTRVYDGPKGLTVAMHSGMLVYFGDASRVHAKWLAFASVLVASHAASASYVDVRLPERPAIAAGAAAEAAGTAEGGSAGGATAAQGSLATSAALAVGLQAAIGGETGAPGSPSSSGGTTQSGTEEGGSGGSGEAQSGSEASSAVGSEGSGEGSGEGSAGASSGGASEGTPHG
jgi:cell division protein FtsQ